MQHFIPRKDLENNIRGKLINCGYEKLGNL